MSISKAIRHDHDSDDGQYTIRRYIFIVLMFLYASVFILDTNLPNGYGVGNLYVGAIFLTFLMSSTRQIVSIALLGIFLLMVGYLVSPEGPAPSALEQLADRLDLLTNRLFAVLAIGFGAWLAILYRDSNAALKRNEGALRQAHSLARLGHFELPLAAPYRISCSAECLHIAGLKDAKGKSLRSLIRQIVHPDDRSRILKLARDALRQAGRYEMEVRIVRPDGEVRDVRSAGQIEKGDRGNPDWLTGTLLDVSEWRRSERARRESEARMKSILDSVFDALIIINQQGEIESLSASAEALFGYQSSELLGKPADILLATRSRGVTEGLVSSLLESRSDQWRLARRRSLLARRKDGSTLNVELAISPIPMSGMLTVFVRDLTGSQRLEEQLRQAQKMDAIGQLTGGIAHDFNNLLTVIMGNLERLEGRIKRASDSALVREAREAAELGSQLTERLLAFGRRQALDTRNVDLGQLVGGLLSLLRRSLGEQVDVQLHCEPGLPQVVLDPSQLQVALFNLALNARDAMPRGGSLEISIAEVEADHMDLGEEGVVTGRFVVLSVRDSGTGMPATVRRRALEPFFTTKQPGKGTGLGLPMVYGFVKQSNGHMTIDSEEGKGTTVHLYLPPAPHHRKRKRTNRRRMPAVSAGQGQNILVVEDDPRVRRLAVSRLKDLGYQVIEAANGPEALDQLAKAEDVALLFSDHVMPGGMSGIDLARAARALRPGIKVLLTTGYARPEQIQRGRIEGVKWLSKPYLTDDLARAVHRALPNHLRSGPSG